MSIKSKPNWGTRWLNPKARVIRSSIEGLGVEAVKPISKGEAVGVLGGIVVPKEEIEAYWKKMGVVGIQISDGFYIVPPNKDEIKKYGVYNHSCSPNLGFDNSSNVLYAIRSVKKGEELVFDYAMCEAHIRYKSFTCNCRSNNCRKIVTSSDWKRKDIQKKYGKYFSPFLKAKTKNKK